MSMRSKIIYAVKNNLLKKILQVSMLAVAWFCPHSYAADSVSLEIGAGNRTEMARLGLQWRWDKRWHQADGMHVGGYWDLTAAHWRNTRYQNIPGRTNDFTVIGITPVFRLQNDNLEGLYAEAGIGLRHFFDLYNNNGRQLSTHFQFASHLGIGHVFANNLDLGLKIQHFSNGSIKKPNGGVNLVVLRIGYRF